MTMRKSIVIAFLFLWPIMTQGFLTNYGSITSRTLLLVEPTNLLERNQSKSFESIQTRTHTENKMAGITYVKSRCRSISLKMSNGDNEEGFDPIMILPIATLTAIGLLALGVLYTKMTHPVTDFDIDFYMAIDGVRDLNANANGGIDALDADTIVGLPQLSPAEKLVGALFGPK